MRADPYRAKSDRLRHRVLAGPAVVPPADRQAAYAGQGADPLTAAYVARVHHEAARISDAEVEDLRALHTEDAVFELTVAAATGAGMRRLDRMLDLLSREEP